MRAAGATARGQSALRVASGIGDIVRSARELWPEGPARVMPLSSASPPPPLMRNSLTLTVPWRGMISPAAVHTSRVTGATLNSLASMVAFLPSRVKCQTGGLLAVAISRIAPLNKTLPPPHLTGLELSCQRRSRPSNDRRKSPAVTSSDALLTSGTSMRPGPISTAISAWPTSPSAVRSIVASPATPMSNMRSIASGGAAAANVEGTRSRTVVLTTSLSS